MSPSFLHLTGIASLAASSSVHVSGLDGMDRSLTRQENSEHLQHVSSLEGIVHGTVRPPRTYNPRSSCRDVSHRNVTGLISAHACRVFSRPDNESLWRVSDRYRVMQRRKVGSSFAMASVS